MSVYMILEVEVMDRDAYGEYLERVPAVIKKHGGRYLVRGGQITSFAGDWRPERIVVIEFPSLEHVQRCFNSEEYKPIGAIREKATRARGIIVEGAAEV